MSMKTNELKDADYKLIEGAAWFAIKDFSIRIHGTPEGVIVDVWAKGCEGDDPLASTYAFDSEAEAQEGEKA